MKKVIFLQQVKGAQRNFLSTFVHFSCQVMNDIKEGIQYLFQTRNTTTFAVSGTGHTAMECAIFNAVEAGESVLTAVNGIWGERAAEMAERIGKTWCTFLFFLFSFATDVIDTLFPRYHRTKFSQGRNTTPKVALFLIHNLNN